jgi:hypothetical protein
MRNINGRYLRPILCASLACGTFPALGGEAVNDSIDAARKGYEACTLLSTPVIEKTMGEPVTATKGSVGKGGAVIVAQCLYSLPTFSNSISLTLTLPDPATPAGTRPKELWEQRFHETEEQEQEAAHAREGKEEEAARPVPVSGLGEEAYWVRSFVGTLYVLKGNVILRISMGGKLDDSARLEKARILAGDALSRLP